MSLVGSVEACAAAVPDGARVTFGGFQLNRAPMALARALVKRRARGLRVITIPNPLPLELLIGAGCVTEAEFGFLGFQHEGGFAMAPCARRAVEQGTIAWRERDVYEILQSLRAAAFGVSFLPAPGGEGSDYRRVNETPVITGPDGEEVLVARAVRPDVALLHAQAADRRGNLLLTDPYADVVQSRAAGTVVATAETIVERLEQVTIPWTRVSCVAEAPGGAYPTSCHGRYPYAPGPIAAWIDTAAHAPEDAIRLLERAAGDAGRIGAWPGWRAQDAAAGPASPAADRLAAADRVVVGLARRIQDGDVVTTGVASALPMLAVAVARATHAPRLRYINCVGAVDPEIPSALSTSVDARLLDRCAARVELPELFDLARRGSIDLMFFGAGQIDGEARMNLTCIGEYRSPRVKLPGPAGSPAMRAFVPKVVIFVPRHSTRTLVPAVDFVTSAPSARNRETTLVSDLGLLRLHAGRLRLASRHAGTTRAAIEAATGFPLEDLPDGAAERDGAVTPEPTDKERRALERLDPAGLRLGLLGG